MSTMTLEQILRAAEQLTPQDQAALIDHLQARNSARAQAQPELDLLVFDVGPWPEGITLRREDEYADNQR